jgi:hypothetical protein
MEQRKLKVSEKNLIHAGSTKANPAWIGLELNWGLLDKTSE